ncbi:hypothetical protein [Yinghuangia sp. YIM S10712]|uniref:hypothetical protein n=1 Tax=Yinghuangia sp. YIM S10712 TaxID=3436930 RepID=UPI003F53137C
MDWAAPLSAIAGALAGIVATYVVDRGRWKQTREAESNQILRETFVAYLSHLARAVENMRYAAEAAYDTPEERRRAIRGAFSETGLFEQRYGLTMLAPPAVVEAGVDAFRRVRDLRDLLADGAQVSDGAFQTAQHRYFRSVIATSDAMREELRIPHWASRLSARRSRNPPPSAVSNAQRPVGASCVLRACFVRWWWARVNRLERHRAVFARRSHAWLTG